MEIAEPENVEKWGVHPFEAVECGGPRRTDGGTHGLRNEIHLNGSGFAGPFKALAFSLKGPHPSALIIRAWSCCLFPAISSIFLLFACLHLVAHPVGGKNASIFFCLLICAMTVESAFLQVW